MSGSVTAIADTSTHRQAGAAVCRASWARNGGKNRIIHKPTTATFSCNVGHSAHPSPRGRTSVPPDQQPPKIFDQAEPITAASVWSSSRRTGKVVAVSRADEHRRRAQQCLEMARTFGDRDARVALSHMAEVWLRLAERNVPKQTQPAFQQ